MQISGVILFRDRKKQFSSLKHWKNLKQNRKVSDNIHDACTINQPMSKVRQMNYMSRKNKKAQIVLNL